MNNELIDRLNKAGIKSIKFDLQKSEVDIELIGDKDVVETHRLLYETLTKLVNSIDSFTQKKDYTKDITLKADMKFAYISSIDDLILDGFEHPLRRGTNTLKFSYRFDYADIKFGMENSK